TCALPISAEHRRCSQSAQVGAGRAGADSRRTAGARYPHGRQRNSATGAVADTPRRLDRTPHRAGGATQTRAGVVSATDFITAIVLLAALGVFAGVVAYYDRERGRGAR